MNTGPIEIDASIWVHDTLEVREQVLSAESVCLHVGPPGLFDGPTFRLFGSPDSLAQLIADLDKHRNRAVEQIASAREQAEYAAEVRAISGEHPAVEVGWSCEDCGWTWHLAGNPPSGAECDSCGGPLAQDGTA